MLSAINKFVENDLFDNTAQGLMVESMEIKTFVTPCAIQAKAFPHDYVDKAGRHLKFRVWKNNKLSTICVKVRLSDVQ